MRRFSIVAALVLTALVAGCGQQSSELASSEALPAPPPPPPPPPVLAQGVASPENDTIVVSATRVTGAQQDSPLAVTSVTAETLSGDIATSDLVAAAPGDSTRNRYYVPPVLVPGPDDREKYDGETVSPIKLVRAEPVSTFSVDVDTGAYANVRRFLNQGQLPPKAAVRTEEMINYFRYDYARPSSRDVPFSVTTNVTTTPWNSESRLVRIGLRGYDIARDERPAANLVFLLDVSGSMNNQDKLPLLKSALKTLTNNLSDQDRVSIVVYAGAAGLVLEPTNDKGKIKRALDQLEAGGSTAGGAGIKLAYQIARDNRIKDGVNRVIMATDGDFNVGISDRDRLIELIESNRDDGITLTTLGFGQGNYNEALMEQAADHGNGNYAYIDSAQEAQKVLADEMQSTLFTIAKDVKVQVEFNPKQISQYRLIGYENRALREEDFDNDKIDAGDIGAGHQVTAIYEVVPADAQGWIKPRRYEQTELKVERGRESEMAFVKLRYKLPNEDTSKLLAFAVQGETLRTAKRPKGDMAFAVAVAAFGQKLRADPYLKDFNFDDILQMADGQNGYLRQEFIKLAEIARGQSGAD
ncbi:YfbK domain-containing protein [Parasphingorhabdus sp. DH2-15]|uniref:vWA domain-containing protein n=1 Tax=Parasphingorhabdus sp. DH2-15 TaxID=3444112 RepID=UPI003F684EA4